MQIFSVVTKCVFITLETAKPGHVTSICLMDMGQCRKILKYFAKFFLNAQIQFFLFKKGKTKSKPAFLPSHMTIQKQSHDFIKTQSSVWTGEEHPNTADLSELPQKLRIDHQMMTSMRFTRLKGDLGMPATPLMTEWELKFINLSNSCSSALYLSDKNEHFSF